IVVLGIANARHIPNVRVLVIGERDTGGAGVRVEAFADATLLVIADVTVSSMNASIPTVLVRGVAGWAGFTRPVGCITILCNCAGP
ncbi:MAG: hypothetical protein V2I33_25010, partial [Kangiellaceae bacterium]|nr:hypothetical protein [Kangiellaceae bacterium]